MSPERTRKKASRDCRGSGMVPIPPKNDMAHNPWPFNKVLGTVHW